MEMAADAGGTAQRLLGTADAIDALLDQALAARCGAVGAFRTAEKQVDAFRHAQMYSDLSKLPKNKVGLFKELARARDELGNTRETLDKTSKLLRCQIRALKARVADLEAAAEALEGENSALRDANARLGREASGLRQRLERIASEHADALREERSKHAEAEGKLRRQLEEQARKFAQEKDALLERQAELELEIDEYRGLAKSAELGMMELEYGLRGFSRHPHCEAGREAEAAASEEAGRSGYDGALFNCEMGPAASSGRCCG